MILCLGTTPVYQRSMVFERVEPDGVNRAAAVYDYASGKSINVARVLHAMGGAVVATGFVGGGRGRALAADLGVAGVSHEFVDVEAPTRQCVTVIDRTKGTATELVEESQPVGSAGWAKLHATFAALLPSAEALVLSGSLPPGAPQDFYAVCLRAARGRAIPALLDARGEPLRQARAAGAFVVKLNREELAATVGRQLPTDADLLRAAREMMPEDGAAVVTLGRGGAIAADPLGAWRIRAPSVKALSAVGSGDASAAGLVLGLARGESFPDACALGAACGAANALTELAGFLRAEDVERLRGQVVVQEL